VRTQRLKSSVVILIAAVAALNVAAWLGLFAVSWTLNHALLDIGALAYLLGLRHGFDADHIAAIDNVTRKLRHDSRPSAAVGFFFALGHSTIVILMTLVLVTGVSLHAGGHYHLPAWGGLVGAIISATFLTLIGVLNLVAFIQLWGAFRLRARAEDGHAEIDRQIAALLERRGIGARVFRFIYARITAGWNMYFVGLLFGLGFDTATEIALLGISAGAAARHAFPFWSVMILPVLFTAGMAMVDTLDGAVMERMYEWAADDDDLKLVFNIVVTGLTVLIAMVVGGIQWLQLMSRGLAPGSALAGRIDALDFTRLGVSIVVLIVGIWIVAWWNLKRGAPVS
jgi:nickel/cobalt transporter (NiCoT) family protein